MDNKSQFVSGLIDDYDDMNFKYLDQYHIYD